MSHDTYDFSGQLVHSIPTPAKSVVIREAEHRFDVDGKPFPWIVEAHGPALVQYTESLWTVKLTFFPGLQFTGTELVHANPSALVGGRYVPPREHGSWGLLVSPVPVIDGRPFPWLLHSDGYEIKHGARHTLTVTLTFLAENVDTDGPVVHATDTLVDVTGTHYGGHVHTSVVPPC